MSSPWRNAAWHLEGYVREAYEAAKMQVKHGERESDEAALDGIWRNLGQALYEWELIRQVLEPEVAD